MTAIDLQANTLAVHVARTSRSLSDFVGKNATIDVPASAMLYVMHGRLAVAATIDQLTAGDVVYATGSIDRGNPGTPVLTARQILATHVAAGNSLTWFACTGSTCATDARTGAVTVTVIRGTLALSGAVGGKLTLTANAGSAIRTLVSGVVTTESVPGVSLGRSIVVVGTIDRSKPGALVYDIGQAFVW